MFKTILPILALLLPACTTLPPADVYPITPIPAVSTTQIPPVLQRESISVALALSQTYRRPIQEMVEIVRLAELHADPKFPKKEHILAIIAVESSFKPKAHNRGSFGLMQIQAKSHRGKIRERSLMDPSVNIEVGVVILKEYYQAVGGDKRAAFLSYNAGLGGYKSGKYNSSYFRKIEKEQKKILNSGF